MSVPYRWEPRPDLTEDSDLWQQLLSQAFTQDGENLDGAYGVLHGLRCCGARLEWRLDGHLYLTDCRLPGLPSEQPGTGTGCYAGDWAADRQMWLMPLRSEVTGLIRATEVQAAAAAC